MIITDNYILKVFKKDKETHIFSYETPDVWTALEEFWHEDYEHIAGNDSWDIDAYVMENGEVIDTYKFHLCTPSFHSFFDNKHLTTTEFAKCIERKEEADKVWVFTAEQAWDGEFADIIVKTFLTESSAVKYMHDFLIDEGGDESIRQYVKRKGWETEIDEPMIFRAYKDGYYGSDHIELTITKCTIEKQGGNES